MIIPTWDSSCRKSWTLTLLPPNMQKRWQQYRHMCVFPSGVAFCGVLNLLGSWWFGLAEMLVFWRFHVENTFLPLRVCPNNKHLSLSDPTNWSQEVLSWWSFAFYHYRNGCFLVSCSTGSFEVMRFPFHRHNSRNFKSGSKQSTIEVVKNLLISQNWLIKVTPPPYPLGAKHVSSLIFLETSAWSGVVVKRNDM